MSPAGRSEHPHAAFLCRAGRWAQLLPRRRRALQAVIAVVILLPLTLGLVGCSASGTPADGTSGVVAGLDALHDDLTSIGGVEEAQVTPNTDGAPTQRRLTVVLYVSDLSAASVTPIVAETLREIWRFNAFIPVGYAIEVWPAPVPEPPVNYDEMFAMETILPELDLDGGYVYDRQLALDAVVLETKFGPRS